MVGSDVERAVVGAILLDSDNLRKAREIISPGDFSDSRIEIIFTGMCRMFDSREPVDVITVSNRLGSWGVNIESGFLQDSMDTVPHVSAVVEYASQVHEDAVRKKLVAAARIILDTAHSVDSGSVITDAMAMLRSARDGGRSSDIVGRLLDDVLVGGDDYDWVIPGLLERKDRLILTGHEGMGKTQLVRQLAILSSAGIHPFTFARMEPARVLVVDAENTERQWRRETRHLVLQAKRDGLVNPGARMVLASIRRLDITSSRDLGHLHRLMDEHKPDVLFIGPLYRLTPRAINSDDEATPLLAALDSLRERGVALVIEAHAGHASSFSGERDVRPKGSSALMAWPEFGLGLLFNKKEGSGRVFDVVKWRGNRSDRDWPLQLTRGGKWPWEPMTAGNAKSFNSKG